MNHNQNLTLNNQLPITCAYAGGVFKLSAKGVAFTGLDKDGNELPPRWICSPLHVVAKTRDAKNGEWGDYWNGKTMMA